MGTTLFFAKLNLATENIYDIYADPQKMKFIKFALVQAMQREGSWTKETTYLDDNGSLQVTTIDYHLHTLGVSDNFSFVEGWLYKDSVLYYKSLKKGSSELQSKSVKNTEAIRFLFDIEHEFIGYDTKARFGYKEFMEAFVEILNSELQSEEHPFFFTISRCSKGLNLSDIKKELNSIPQIKELKIRIQPPNPERELLEHLQSIGEGELANMKSANVTQMNLSLVSAGGSGLNLESNLIDTELNKLQGIHQKLSVEEATKRGYVQITATSSTGKQFSTENSKPFKKIISFPSEFIDACKDAFTELLS